MAKRMLYSTATALMLAVAAACSQPANPISPTAAPTGTDAAADGSTLKVTAPALVFPVGGLRTDTLEPVFRIGSSSARFGNSPTLEYRIEVYNTAGQLIRNSPKLTPGANGQSSWEFPDLLTLDTRYRWRARAEMGNRFGPWSANAEFLSLDYRGIVPRPPDGKWPSDPEVMIAYIMDSFPERLVTTEHLPERIENMEFLRDRIIEAGRCGGLDLAWNLKRGIGPHSHDAIAWRTPSGDDEVVDIASAFDDENIPLQLHWAIVSGPPGYDPYPNHPGC